MLAFLYLYGQHIYPTYFPEKYQCFNNCRRPRAKLLDQNLNLSQQNRHQPSVGSRSAR